MKILITSVSCGAGHLRAAEALETAVRTSHPWAEVAHINLMDYVSVPFRGFYEGGYNFLAKHAPRLWGQIYDFADRPLFRPLMHLGGFAFQRSQSGRFFDYLHKFQPNKIITTHFLMPQLVAGPLKKKVFNFSIETVITDFAVHRLWIEPCISRYYVAHEGLIKELGHFKIPADRVSVTGIPIDPIFLKDVDTEHVRLHLELDQIKPVVLVLAGGFGFGHIEKIVRRLFNVAIPIQIVAVAGKNERLRERIAALTPPANVKLVTLGYSKNMHELLSISNLVITKAGGLTVSEGLAKGAPMIFYGLLPGQEVKNATYIEDREAGILVWSLSDMLDHSRRILGSSVILSKMRDNARAAGKPQAAFDVAEIGLRGFSH